MRQTAVPNAAAAVALSPRDVATGGTSVPRVHALDGLRAAMMLLGLVLHSAMSYIVTPFPHAWPYKDPRTNDLFDLLVIVIHEFRMPTFFVVAGFLGALLMEREGPHGFVRHRARRLLLPLLVLWPLLFPLVRAGFKFAQAGGGLEAAWGSAFASPYADPNWIHLWFIYDLVLLCAVAALIVPLVRRLSPHWRARVLDHFGRVAPTGWGCLAFGLLSGVSMLPMRDPGLDTAVGFVPVVRVLVAYGVYFSFGWLMFHRRERLDQLARHPWRYLAVGLVASGGYFALGLKVATGSRELHAPAVMACGVATWLLVFGLIGLSLRYFNAPRPLQRYLSDAAYWMYLVHLPFTIWLPGAMQGLALPVGLKYLVVLGATTAVTLVSYHLFVRSTAIGVFLNGRRFSRALPV